MVKNKRSDQSTHDIVDLSLFGNHPRYVTRDLIGAMVMKQDEERGLLTLTLSKVDGWFETRNDSQIEPYSQEPGSLYLYQGRRAVKVEEDKFERPFYLAIAAHNPSKMGVVRVIEAIVGTDEKNGERLSTSRIVPYLGLDKIVESHDSRMINLDNTFYLLLHKDHDKLYRPRAVQVAKGPADIAYRLSRK